MADGQSKVSLRPSDSNSCFLSWQQRRPLTPTPTLTIRSCRYINDGLKIVKIAAAAGRLAGLPLPSCAGLPMSVVSKAEVQAVANLESLMGGAADFGDGGKMAPKAVTGQAYKFLRKVLKEQCQDEQLIHCDLKKVKAKDGSIEFVGDGAAGRFFNEGARCLVWNNLPPPLPSAPPTMKVRGGEGSAALGGVAMGMGSAAGSDRSD